MLPNMHYAELKESYLFSAIGEKVRAYAAAHPGQKLFRLGVGDVSLPLCPVVIRAMHDAVAEQGNKRTFHGYLPETGTPFLKEAIRAHYETRGILLETDEIFISSGASNDIGDLSDLFDPSNTALVADPAYPEYADSSMMAGRKVVYLPTRRENGFLPLPDPSVDADLIYLCSPNNPTGAVFDRRTFQSWVDYANAKDAVILFDAAYEIFIDDPAYPRSVYELDGAENCAIEICSLSKTAGFTGTRLGYTVVPKALKRNGMSLNAMWVRNRSTTTNGVSYILQKGGEAAFTPEGRRELRKNISYYKSNARVIMSALDELNVWYCGGVHSPYIWMECPGGMDSWTFFDRLLNEAQVIGTPGAGFGACGEGYFRLSAFGDADETKEAAERMKVFWRKS